MIAAAVITSRRTGLSILRRKPTLPFMTLDCFKIKFEESQCLSNLWCFLYCLSKQLKAFLIWSVWKLAQIFLQLWLILASLQQCGLISAIVSMNNLKILPKLTFSGKILKKFTFCCYSDEGQQQHDDYVYLADTGAVADLNDLVPGWHSESSDCWLVSVCLILRKEIAWLVSFQFLNFVK